MQLGLDNKKKTTWAIVLGVVAIVIFAYEFSPMFTQPSGGDSNAQAAAPSLPHTPPPRGRGKAGKKTPQENLDPTLRLDLLAASEQTRYEGDGRNIFVSQMEDIPKPIASAHTDPAKQEELSKYTTPAPPPPQPIPLKFYGFASSPGEPKKIFLKLNDDVFVAGEGEIVDRRYKVIRITNTFVEIQDVVNSGPSQNIPLTQG